MATTTKKETSEMSMDSLIGANAPDHIEATFEGQYFKGTANGGELEYYKSTCKIPTAWLERDDLNPMGFFRKLLAKRPSVLGDKAGFSGVHTCQLIATSPLPQGLSDEAFLRWSADYSALLEFAKRKKAPIAAHLYADANELREAIRRYLEEPDAFIKEQKQREGSKEIHYRNLESDLVALGY